MEACVQWYEGMLISPQHFQQSENYLQHLLREFSSAHSAFGYGVYDLKIDTSALASGVIRVLNARGIFKDGLFFDFDALHDSPLERNLSEYFATSSTPVKIYLAVPARKVGENQLTGDMARYYSSEISNVCDENTGDNPKNISTLKPRLKLLLENEMDARYTGFPIFEAQKSIDGGVVSTDYIAPYITINEHSKIAEMCREVAQIIRGKVSYFADRKDNYSRTASDESMASLRLLIQAALPLEAIVRTNDIQPFEVYKYLLNAISFIVSINPTQLIPRLTIYDHENLFYTFSGLLQYARDVLGHLKQQYDIIHFDKDGDTFKLQMKKEWLEKGTLAIGVQKPFILTDDDMLNWIKGVRIASESMLPMIRDKRVLGAERVILERGEYITQPNGMTIISVKVQPSFIKSAEKLCLVNNSVTFVPEEVILYADC